MLVVVFEIGLGGGRFAWTGWLGCTLKDLCMRADSCASWSWVSENPFFIS